MRRNPQTISFWLGRLPHWEVVDGRYFVTLHLAGAIPWEGQRRIRELVEELKARPAAGHKQRHAVRRKIFRETERWLDRASAVTTLRCPELAKSVMEAIEYRSAIGIWNMYEYVLMPSHLHLFFELLNGRLKPVMHSFKTRTGRLGIPFSSPNASRFWQHEWFDHWSRSDEEDERIIRYIRANPVTAGLVTDDSDWPYRSSRL